jgi:UrcA family protein
MEDDLGNIDYGSEAMIRLFVGIAVGTLASGAVSTSFAAPPEVEEVTVTASRILTETPAGSTTTGVPIVDISLSYGVSYAGLDLASHSGATELEKRVREAAQAACKEITRQRPLVHMTPDDATCAKVATDKAMPKVHELVAAAEKHRAP